MKVIERQIRTVQIAGRHLLAAVYSGADETLTLAFKSGFGENVRLNVPGFSAENFRPIGGGGLLSGSFEKPEGDLEFTLDGEGASAAVTMAERALFKGLNAAILTYNGEGSANVAEWLRYHATHHRLNGAVIVDRSPPDSAGDLAAALAEQDLADIECVAVVTCDLPLGKTGTPDESHPFNAPDAPGKDRMEIPDPRPWTAPFGEAVIFELMRAWFLDDVRAVTNIELIDLMPIKKGPSVFDMAQTAAGGVVAMIGQRIYPWSIRKGQAPQFGDHICRRFDGGMGNPRWCVAPSIAGPQSVWRPIRVVGTPTPARDPVIYHRCMAMRHPNARVSEIVPKASLIEDTDLIKRARRVFGHKPVRSPEAKMKPRAKDSDAVTIVTTMKNEAPFILEWIAHHRSIGIENFLIYTNDCTDGTDQLLDRLQQHGIVQRRNNPFQKMKLKPQHAALQAAESEQMVKRAGWLVCMDVDEFINIHAGEGTMSDLFSAVGDANMISMTWRLFGNSDVAEYRDDLLVEQFTRCAPQLARKPHQAWGFKTLFRNVGLYKKLGVHRPKGLKPQLVDEIKWVNGSGRDLPQSMYRNAWRSTAATIGYDLVTLNHYAVRSAESFLVKRDRGRVNHVDRDQGMNYWFRMNNNFEEDRSIQRRVPAIRQEMDRLLALPGIAEAHANGIQCHRDKITELRARDDYASFYADITGERMQKMSRMHQNFGRDVFLQGPHVVPDEIVHQDHPPNFFYRPDLATEQSH